MKYWMHPANPKIFKITELFQKRDVVDWRHRCPNRYCCKKCDQEY